jgi:glyoxylase-like metal-dependent hydrolase (beta-lactamase superfamily II)/rhodanese-related sulfurtransferase
MKFTQYYLECLSQASYLIGDETTGKAVVVDPKRDIQEYLDDAKADGFAITHVVMTHFHADFLAGHLEMAAATGAEIIYGAAAKADFDFRPVVDGETLSLGEVELEFRETPGHTPESISIVVRERAGDEVPYGVLTGDTLFIGDVGRPDLLASVGVTADELAHSLYRSLHERLMVLPDATKVYPAHGAGSACGKNLSTETVSTIGEQRRTNYAVQPMSVEAFVEAVTEGQPAAPGYFIYNATLNKQERDLIDIEPPAALSVDQVLEAQANGAIAVDTRDSVLFATGHLAGSINVGIEGRYAEYAGSVVTPDQDIVLVTGPGEEHEAKVRLARIGYDRVLGALEGGVDALADRPELVTKASRLTLPQLDEALEAVEPQLIDIRNPGETALGTIPGATLIPLAQLPNRLDEVDLDRPVVVFCAGGYRSSVAASLLRQRGATDVSDVLGGYGAWLAARDAIVA